MTFSDFTNKVTEEPLRFDGRTEVRLNIRMKSVSDQTLYVYAELLADGEPVSKVPKRLFVVDPGPAKDFKAVWWPDQMDNFPRGAEVSVRVTSHPKGTTR